jgi:prohibitin 2
MCSNSCSWAVIGIGVVVAILLSAGFTVIPPGEVGIVVTLGRVSTFEPGAHFRIPCISYLKLMSTKTQLLEQQNVIPTKEGLAVQLDTAV